MNPALKSTCKFTKSNGLAQLRCLLAKMYGTILTLIATTPYNYIKYYKFKNEVGIQAIKSSETRDEQW